MNVATAAVSASIPLESLINSFNTNPYFIGIMMLIMNLGGRFLAMEITKEQEKIFQNPWIRRILIIIVIFIATRNLFVAFWLGLAVILIMSILLNETSPLFIGAAIGKKKTFETSTTPILTPEEADIYRKLSDKLAKVKVPDGEPINQDENHEAIENIYSKNMTHLQNIF